MKPSTWIGVLLLLAVTAAGFAKSHSDEASGPDPSRGLRNAVILIIRHAEKPEEGEGLTAAGESRARAYAGYFKDFNVAGQPLKPDCLYAAADSSESHRPRLTLEPTGRALGLIIDSRFKDKQFLELVQAIRARQAGNNILICWHHGEIPHLLRALGADPQKLLPGGKWPNGEFGWLILLRYDGNGQLAGSRRINENLPAEQQPTHP